MAALKRLQQLYLAIELREASTTTGTYQNQTGKMLPIEPTLDFDMPRYNRAVNRQGHLTELQGLTGIRTGRARWGLELAASTGPNQFQDTLRCCGFADEPVGRFTIGAVTAGPFRHGETVSQASSGATGTVVSDIWTGQTSLWVAQAFQFGDGTFDGTGVLVGASSGAQATPSAFDSSGGRAWWPYSYRTSVLQFDGSGLLSNVTNGHMLRGVTSRAVATVFHDQTAGVGQQVVIERQYSHFTGGEVVENLTLNDPNIGTTPINGYEVAIRGCTASIGLIKDIVRERIDWARGTFKLAGTVGEPALFAFEFLGAERSVIDQGISLHPDVSAIHVPPVLLGATLLLGRATDPPSALVPGCIRSFTIDMAHDLQIQECMALSVSHGPFFGPPHDDDTPRGVDMAMIVGRRPTITIDPYLQAEALFPWVDAYINNRSLRAELTIGTTAPDKFIISIPSMTPRQVAGGDYNGLSVRNITLDLDGGNAPGPRGDNEIVIIQDLG